MFPARIPLFILVYLIAVGCSLAQAASTVTLAGAPNELKLAPYLSWFHDKENRYSLQTFREIPTEYWQPISGDIPNFGSVRGRIWLKTRLRNDSEATIDKMVHIRTSNIGEISLLVVAQDEVVYQRSSSYREPVALRPIHHREFVFPVAFSANQNFDLYISATSHNPIQLPVTLWSPNEFYADDAWNSFYWGTFFGLMAVMVMYNGFLGVATRVVMYLYYVIFVIGICASQLLIRGIPAQFFSDGFSIQSPYWLPLSIFGSVLGAALFSNQFFRLRRDGDWRYWWNVGNALFAGLGVLLTFIIPYSFVLGASVILVLEASVTALVIGSANWKKTGLPAFYFTTAWLTLILGAMVLVLSRYGFIASTNFTEQAMRLGAVMDVTLLSLALASQINQEKRERIQAQEQALSFEREARDAQYKSLEMQRRSAHHLEKLVAERTSELNLALQELDLAAKSKNRFLAAVSHDLRQPMQAIHLMVASLYKRRTKNDGLLEPLQQSVEQLSQMFTGLLDYSSLESGHIEPKLVGINLVSLIEDVLQEQRDNIEQARQTITFRAKPVFVHCDQVLLGRILRNLLVNIQKHAGPCRALIAIRPHREHCILEIVDDGIGIHEDKLARIFEDYFRVNNESRHSETGLGLGLGIVQRLCAILDIPLSIRSKYGHGTHFTLKLAYGAAPETFGAIEGLYHHQDKAEIAIVDDDQSITNALTTFLTDHGYIVRAFNNLDDFFHHLTVSGWQPELLLCDISLGGQRTFFDLLEQYRQLQLALPSIITITGESDPTTKQRLDDRNIPMLSKPVKPAKLLMAIERLLNG